MLTPKGDKDRRLIGNWRPLTVLETLYELTLAILANRMKPTLDIIIGSSQMAYLPGRFISECTRNAYDLLIHAKENKLPVMLLLLVFEKAFDSVYFGFILATWDVFGIKEGTTF